MQIIIWWFGDNLKNKLLLRMLVETNALGEIEMTLEGQIIMDALRMKIMCLKDSLRIDYYPG